MNATTTPTQLLDNPEVIRNVNVKIEKIVAMMLRSHPELLVAQTRDDLRQEGWVAVMECLSRFDPDRANFYTFVSYRVQGRLQELTRRKHRFWTNVMQSVQASEVLPHQLPVVHLDYETCLDNMRRWECIRSTLADLPAEPRCVLEQHYFDGLKVAEIDPDRVSKIRNTLRSGFAKLQTQVLRACA